MRKAMNDPKALDAESAAQADELYARYAGVHPAVEDAVYVDPMVTTSLRLPAETQKAVRAAAKRAGVRPTVLIRSWIEQGLAGQQAGAGVVPVAELEELIVRHRAAS
ncbi:MAG: hypothetical protein ACOYB4_03425 [Methyloceanibacter sp.]